MTGDSICVLPYEVGHSLIARGEYSYALFSHGKGPTLDRGLEAMSMAAGTIVMQAEALQPAHAS